MPSGKGCLWKPMNDRVSLLVQSPSHVFLFATLWTEAFQAFLSLTISQSFSKFISLASVMPSSHLILWRSILLLPWIFPSTCPDFSSELAVQIRWPKYWSFSISPSKEYSGLISFRMDWLDLLAVQGTLKTLQFSNTTFSNLQFKSINSLALSLLYSPTLTSIHDYWKNHSLD